MYRRAPKRAFKIPICKLTPNQAAILPSLEFRMHKWMDGWRETELRLWQAPPKVGGAGARQRAE